jgi:hypothetical protein
VDGGGLATNVLIGYLEGVTKRDAEAYARSFAQRTLAPSGRGFFAVEPLWSGFLYEVQEGGPGRSYLPDLAREMDSNLGCLVLIPSGRRVFEMSVRNGRPVGSLLPESRSREVQVVMSRALPTQQVQNRAYGVVIPAWVTSDQIRFRAIRTTRRMKRVWSPVSVALALSAVGFAAGLGLLVSGAGLYLWSPHRAPRANPIALDGLPHRQWEMVLGAVTAGNYASKLEYRDGRWVVETADPAPPKK